MTGNTTVAAVIARDLAALGARRCFGLLGTANFKISHALVGAGVELISARHEGNAAKAYFSALAALVVADAGEAMKPQVLSGALFGVPARFFVRAA